MCMDRKDILQQALGLSRQPEDHSIELARCLAKLNIDAPLTDFIVQSPISKRKAYYLAEVGKKLDELGATDERLEQIGWTKLHVISKHLEKRAPEELLDLAERHTVHELQQMLPDNPLESRSSRCVILYFSPEQYADFEREVLAHGGEKSGRGLIHKENAVMAMIRKLDPK